MHSTVEPLDGNKVKLSVEVDADEFDKAVDAAFRKLAGQVNVRGFRRGKVPRRVLEAHLGGTAAARQQALQDVLPDYYAEAVRTHEVDVIAQPDIDITAGADDGPVAFDAVVEVRPEIAIDGYDELQVTIPRPPPPTRTWTSASTASAPSTPTSRRPTGRPPTATRCSSTSPAPRTVRRSRVSSPRTISTRWARVRWSPRSTSTCGAPRPATTLDFDAAHPEEGEPGLHFTVEVKEVRGSVLPELTDEWVAESTEHESVETWRANLREQLDRSHLVAANMAMQQRAAEALAGLVDAEVPEAMVDSEVSARIQNMAARLRQQNIELGRYLQLSGTTAEQLVEQHREPAVQAIKVDLALRAIAEAEALEVTDEDLDRHFADLARQYGMEATEIRQNFERAGQVPAVRSEIRKGKALDWVLDRVALVDEDGNAVDRSALELPAPVHDHADHDHDHGDDASDEADTGEPAAALGEDAE